MEFFKNLVKFKNGLTFDGSTEISTEGIFTGSNIGAYTNFASISVPKGTWLITAGVFFDGPSSPNPGFKEIAVSEFSGSTTTDHKTGRNRAIWKSSSSSGPTTNPYLTITHRVSVTGSSKTFYLKAFDQVGTNANGSQYYIEAVRIR